jgi:hypothetical protein
MCAVVAAGTGTVCGSDDALVRAFLSASGFLADKVGEAAAVAIFGASTVESAAAATFAFKAALAFKAEDA